jgi:hypothetical protein
LEQVTIDKGKLSPAIFDAMDVWKRKHPGVTATRLYVPIEMLPLCFSGEGDEQELSPLVPEGIHHVIGTGWMAGKVGVDR